MSEWNHDGAGLGADDGPTPDAAAGDGFLHERPVSVMKRELGSDVMQRVRVRMRTGHVDGHGAKKSPGASPSKNTVSEGRDLNYTLEVHIDENELTGDRIMFIWGLGLCSQFIKRTFVKHF